MRAAFAVFMVFALAACGAFSATPAPSSGGGSVDGGGVAALVSSLPAPSSGSPSSPSQVLDGGPAPSDSGSEAAALAPYVYVPSAGTVLFSDDFARPDGPLGNGWTVKAASGGFQIVGGTAQASANFSVMDGFADRPSLAADIEVSADLSVSPPADFGGWSTLLVRIQSGSSTTGQLAAYGVQANSASLTVVRYSAPPYGSGYAPFEQVVLYPALLFGHKYRLYARVTGDDSVVIEGAIFDGDKLLASVHAVDTGSERMMATGGVGFDSEEIGTVWADLAVREP